MPKVYQASKSRSGREGWCVLFRHPLRKDREGRSLRLRLGLGTSDESEADRMVAQLNTLLADESYHSPAARMRAEREDGVHQRVLSIFYDEIEARLADPFDLREEFIRTRDLEGYTRVLLLGTTGAGKTTLVRQLIGTDPKEERFPSTSTARTTIFDTEIVLGPPPYRAVVSFLPIDQVRFYIEECVVASVSAAAEGSSEALVVRRFVEHSEQRFRLSYLLGTIGDEFQKDELSDDALDDDAEDSLPPSSSISAEDRRHMEDTLRDFLNRIHRLANTCGKETAEGLGVEVATLRGGDRDAFFDELEYHLHKSDEAQDLVDDVLNEVKKRFDFLATQCERDRRTGWGTRWTLETEGRGEFITAVNWFSSNYAPEFGSLLTPLVQGLRVSGPFQPSWQDGRPQFVLMDGEGLGHTADSLSSLPTSLTKRYQDADAILVVDNAIQPVLAGPQAILRSLVASGNEGKLFVVFTHFDQVQGDNLPTTRHKRNHVLAQLDGAVKAAGEALDPYAARSLARALEDRVYFVGGIQDELSDHARFTREQLTNLVSTLERAGIPLPPADANPVYDLAHLILSVRTAVEEFHENWNARLGHTYRPGITPEHWTRVKALSRRLAYFNQDQYDTLRPVADLIRNLEERIQTFVSTPRSWEPSEPDEETRNRAVAAVKSEVHNRLHALVTTRLFHDQLNEWGQAYQESNFGSARRRANRIRGIYELAAPIPGELPVPEVSQFLDTIRAMFRGAAEAAGAQVLA